MSLTDVMSGSGLAAYAEVALLMFVTIFAVVLGTVVRRRDRAAWDRAKSLPLDGEEVSNATATER
ncbi:MAG: hypothetical protein U1E65_34285 [Myxococcota bacterium]